MSRRLALWLVLLGGAALLVLAVLTVWVAPIAIRRLTLEQISALTGRAATAERFDVDLVRGTVSIANFRLADPVAGTLLTFDRLDARVHRRALARGHLWIEDVTLVNPSVVVVRTGPHRFNISDLLERPPRRRRLTITFDHFRLENGTVTFEDRTLAPARTWVSEHIALEGRDVSTSGRGGGTAHGATTVGGAPVSVDVRDLRLVPVHLTAVVKAEGVDLTAPAAYLPADAAVTLTRGHASGTVTARVDARAGTSLDADVSVRDVAVTRRGQDVPAASAPALALAVRGFDVAESGWSLERVTVEGQPTLAVPALTPPLRVDLASARLVAEDLTSRGPRPARVALTARAAGGGDVDVRGTARLAARSAELRVRLARVDVSRWARYLPVRAALAGVADADALVSVALDRTPSWTARGDAGVSAATVADGGRTLLGAQRVQATGVDVRWPDRIAIDRLRLTAPAGTLERASDGTLTAARLFAPPAPAGAAPPRPGPRPAVTVGALEIDGGTLTIADGAVSPAVGAALTEVSARIRGLAWPATAPATLDVGARLPGNGRLSVRGRASVDQQTADVHVTVTGAGLALARPYLGFRGRVDGTADADVDVTLAVAPLRLQVRGAAGLTEAVVRDGDRPVLSVARVAAAGIDYTWPTRLLVGTLRVDRPWALVARNAAGRLTLRDVFERPRTRAGGGPAPGAAPHIEVADARFENGSTTIVDDRVQPAARFDVTNSSLTVRGFVWPSGTPATVELTTATPVGGTVGARGTFALEGGRADLDVTVRGVALPPVQPYLPIPGRLRGAADADVHLALAFAPFHLAIRGRAGVTRAVVGDGERPLLVVERVDADDVDMAIPGVLRIGRLHLRGPWALLERTEDGRLPLVAALTPRPRAKPTTPAPSDDGKRLGVELGTIVAEAGSARFVDYTTRPVFTEDLSAATLTARDVSTLAGHRATVALRGTLGASAAVAVDGTVGAFGHGVDLEFHGTLRDYPVPDVDPYLVRHVAWSARHGLLGADVHYRVEGSELHADNVVTVSGLALVPTGGDSEFRARTGVPLDLVVALLKDRNGVIHLSVPIAGTLGSPTFDWSEAIWATIRNVVIKVVALPFRLVGHLFFRPDSRIEGVRIEPVTFGPGETALSPEAVAHLGRIAAFLHEAPHVALTLQPVLTLSDETALKRAAVEARLREPGAPAGQAPSAAAILRLYRERLPAEPVPASADAALAALVRGEPTPWAAVRALATGRIDAVHASLEKAGVDARRLQRREVPPAIEQTGTGRVEFDIAALQ